MLSIQNLTHVYPNGTRALDAVSLDIPAGMFGLLGPNGAGKSSLMRTIATLQEPDAGTIRFGELDVLKQKTELRSVLGYLPQEFGLYPNLSAEAILKAIELSKAPVVASHTAVRALADVPRTILPAVQFSGLINPVSSLEGAGAVIGSIYPATWFVTICRGVFSKGLGFADLWPDLLHEGCQQPAGDRPAKAEAPRQDGR